MLCNLCVLAQDLSSGIGKGGKKEAESASRSLQSLVAEGRGWPLVNKLNRTLGTNSFIQGPGPGGKHNKAEGRCLLAYSRVRMQEALSFDNRIQISLFSLPTSNCNVSCHFGWGSLEVSRTQSPVQSCGSLLRGITNAFFDCAPDMESGGLLHLRPGCYQMVALACCFVQGCMSSLCAHLFV